MKKLITILTVLFCPFMAFCQDGFEGMIVERIDASSAMAGATTFRVFIDLGADYQLQAVYGNENHDLIIDSDGTWYNDQFGALTGDTQNEALLGAFPSAAFDSHVSTGASSNSTLGVQYADDNDGTIDGRVTSTLPGGLIPSTNTNADVNGILADAFGTANNTVSVTLGGLIGGAWATTNDNSGSNSDNIIYIGQFTTDGNFDMELNLQLRNTTNNEVEQWVARNAIAGEYESNELIYSTTACEAYNYEEAPSGLTVVQNLNTNKTTLKWDHYNDETTACILRGALSNGTTNTGPFGQILIQGALVAGDANDQDRSAALSPNAQYLLFNPNTFPAGPTNNLVPGAQYMWQAQCGCLIDPNLPLPDRLFASNVHISPFSEFDFFTNLSLQENENQGPEDLKSMSSEEAGVNIYPNPFKDELTLELEGFEGLLEVEVVNAIGEKVIGKSITSRGDVNRLQLDTSSLETGLYILNIRSGNQLTSKRILKS